MSNPAPSPIPSGFHTVTPHLAVTPARDYIDFLKRAFNAVEIGKSEGPNPGGKLMHVEMRIGDSIVMFADDMGVDMGMPPIAKTRHPVHLHLYVPDADATWKQAVAAGCKVIMPIADQFWGDRYGHVEDPFGITWSIASRKEQLTPEEMRERMLKAFSKMSSTSRA